MNFVELLKVVFLGTVEGITEWLPISSTGHMLLVDEFMTLEVCEAYKEMFFVVIQLGSIFAVIFQYWNKIFPFHFKKRPVVREGVVCLWLKVAIACVPTGILGFLFDEYVEKHFGTAISIAAMLILYGIAFIAIEKGNQKRIAKINTIGDTNYKTAILIGLFQSLALIPGTSRSGATIAGALLIGVSRKAAAEFSFFLAIPTMFGASLFKLVKFGFVFSCAELAMLMIGMAVSFTISMLTIRFLINYINQHDFQVFGWYRILIGFFVLSQQVLK